MTPKPNHPNIAAIYDFQEANQTQFLVMEYVPGKTLDHVIGARGLALHDVLKIAIQVASGVAAAHMAGVVHRDIKPANVMVTDQGSVKLLDFGLAKLTDRSENHESATNDAITAQTQEGAIVGTVAYMSPEQAEGRKVDARSDIFSFGSLLYKMVTGRQAFPGETQLSMLSAILTKEPAPLPSGTPQELEKIIYRCLRKDPDRRVRDLHDVKLALEELKEDLGSGKIASSRAHTVRTQRSQMFVAIAGA